MPAMLSFASRLRMRERGRYHSPLGGGPRCTRVIPGLPGASLELPPFWGGSGEVPRCQKKRAQPFTGGLEKYEPARRSRKMRGGTTPAMSSPEK